jgi:hypothetical protein
VAATVLLGSMNLALSQGVFHTLCGALVFSMCLGALAALPALFNRVYALFES